MCDFAIMEKALKIEWIKRIQNEVTSSRKIIPDVMVQQYGNLFFLTRCNQDPKILSWKTFPLSTVQFWCIVVTSKSRRKMKQTSRMKLFGTIALL